jgi:MFS family permease
VVKPASQASQSYSFTKTIVDQNVRCIAVKAMQQEAGSLIMVELFTAAREATAAKVIHRKQILMALFASTAGWSLDLFDLFLLLFVAPTIGALFFPTNVPTLSLAGVYAAFATSCVVRPIGSIVFGNYADKFGRKKALLAAMGGVGVITALMGALPTVKQIGVGATILFVMMRLLQGLFVGGVTASTHTIGTETVPPSWRGWVSGVITGAGGGIGALLASSVFYLMSSIFPGPAFESWGWRCMFFSGLLAAIFALFIFYNLNESPFFVEMQKNKKVGTKAPIKVLFSPQYRRIALINILVVLGAASMYYLTSGYMPTFLGVINKLPKPVAAKALIWGSLVATISPIIVGQLSEMYGRRKAFIGTGILGFGIFGFLGYPHLARVTGVPTITFYAALLILVGNAAYAPVLIFLNERFPTAIRATGTAVCWNFGFAIGGLMPMLVSASSRQVADIPSHLNWFLLVVTALMLIGILAAPETKGNFE